MECKLQYLVISRDQPQNSVASRAGMQISLKLLKIHSKVIQ